jgi:hypothetical protein
MHHIWNAITNANPALAGTILLASFIGVMAWVWWPVGSSCLRSNTAGPRRATPPATSVHPVALRFHLAKPRAHGGPAPTEGHGISRGR